MFGSTLNDFDGTPRPCSSPSTFCPSLIPVGTCSLTCRERLLSRLCHSPIENHLLAPSVPLDASCFPCSSGSQLSTPHFSFDYRAPSSLDQQRLFSDLTGFCSEPSPALDLPNNPPRCSKRKPSDRQPGWHPGWHPDLTLSRALPDTQIHTL